VLFSDQPLRRCILIKQSTEARINWNPEWDKFADILQSNPNTYVFQTKLLVSKFWDETSFTIHVFKSSVDNINLFIEKFDIFHLMRFADKVWFTALTFIHKTILGILVSHMLKCNGQSDVKLIVTSPIKTITSVLKVSTDTTNIPARPIGLLSKPGSNKWYLFGLFLFQVYNGRFLSSQIQVETVT